MGKRAFAITSKHLQAARMYADGQKTADIAASIGAKIFTVNSWFNRDEFQAEIEKFVKADRAALSAEGIANKKNRLAEYDRRWMLMKAVIKARSEWDALADAPGGDTGLIVREFRGNSIEVNYKVDIGFLREMRELEKQAAIEVGDWTEKKELTGADGGAIPVSIEGAIAKAYGSVEQQTTKAD